MSDIDQFRLDFEDWAYRMNLLGEDCEEGIEDIRQQIRDDWQDEEKRAYWIKRAADEAAHTRALRDYARKALGQAKEAAK